MIRAIKELANVRPVQTATVSVLPVTLLPVVRFHAPLVGTWEIYSAVLVFSLSTEERDFVVWIYDIFHETTKYKNITFLKAANKDYFKSTILEGYMRGPDPPNWEL